MISESCRTHRGFTGPMNFKKKKFRTFFFGKSCSRDFGVPGCHPDTLIDLANIALASTFSGEPISHDTLIDLQTATEPIEASLVR